MQDQVTSDQFLYCFVHIEKCGGSTLISLLRKNFGLQHVDLIPRRRTTEIAGDADLDWALKLYPKAFSFAGHSLRPFGQFGRLRERMKFYTVLRDPIQRYASDYLNDRRARGFTGSITEWVAHGSQHDLQTKALSARGSVSEAMDVLERDMAFFSVLENYDAFVQNLRSAVAPRVLHTQYAVKNVSDARLGQADGRRAHVLSEAELDLVRRANTKDLALYDWAQKHLASKPKLVVEAGQSAPLKKSVALKQSFNLMANRWVRNFAYKPSCGLWPAEVDILPRYRVNAADFSAVDAAIAEQRATAVEGDELSRGVRSPPQSY